MRVKVDNPEQFTRRMFFLLWKACGDPLGMGILQDRGGATEEEVFANVQTNGDYPFNPRADDGELYGDYVFGRMMKWGCSINDGVITIRDFKFRPDYQGFSSTYPDNHEVVKATAESLNVPFEIEAPDVQKLD